MADCYRADKNAESFLNIVIVSYRLVTIYNWTKKLNHCHIFQERTRTRKF